MHLETTHDFYTIVMNQTPLIDVRAPIEFEKGAFYGAVNLPIMDNEERHQIGIEYKESGNENAVKLGYQLVSGDNKTSKLSAWIDFISTHPSAMIYCFRGGQRSRIAQEWIQDALKQPILRLEGGFKAFRNYLMTALLPEHQNYKPIRLGGSTGSGKTILLRQLENIIDLEKIAHHRGSAFGDFATPQPTQINFENNLAYTLIRQQAKGYHSLIFEDESRNVGRNFIPKDLVEFSRSGDYVILDVPLERRVQITLNEYVKESQEEYIQLFQNEGLEKWHNYIINSLTKMKKRLGAVAYNEVIILFEAAYAKQLASENYKKHEDWIRWLLEKYYDPMYDYQMSQVNDKIAFRGNETAVMDYLRNT